MTDTRRKLIHGAIVALRERGISGTSARSIAALAGVNQALIFYHFGSVDELISVACQQATAERVALYRDRLGAVRSLTELLTLARDLHAREREAGNVAALAQVLAGAQQDKNLAAAAGAALRLWVAEIEPVVRRVLRSSPIRDLADPAGLARAVAASFIGIELYEGVDPAGAAAALDALQRLAVLADVVDDLGPAARLALRARLRASRPLLGDDQGKTVDLWQ